VYALTLDCWDRSGRVKVRHVFYGRSEQECRDLAEEEMDQDGYLSEAEEDDRVGEFLEPIEESEVPTAEDYDVVAQAESVEEE